MKKISIIIPIYNAENYLKKCLNSIVEQKMIDDLQIVLINDGSTDNSEKIIDEYYKLYPQSVIKLNKLNGGQASARNKGLEVVNAEYIMFVDSDDYIEKDCLLDLYKYTKNNNYELVTFDYNEIDSKKTIQKKGLNMQTDNNIINYLLSNMSPWNKIIKSEIFKKNSIKFLENYIYEDLATMPILAGYIKNVGYYNKPIYNYIIYSGSTMRQIEYSPKLESIYYVIEYLIKEFENRKIYLQYSEELECLVIDNLLYAASGRFLKYDNWKENIDKIVEIIKQRYPNWKKNKYYKKHNIVYKLTCRIFYSKNEFLIKTYNKIRNCAK